jgi:hypothetical protein
VTMMIRTTTPIRIEPEIAKARTTSGAIYSPSVNSNAMKDN